MHKNMTKEFATLYTFSYMAIGCINPLIGQYLSGIGLDGSQIGTVTSIGTLTAVFAIAIWGKIYNRAHAKAGVIEFLCGGAICLSAALSFQKTYAMVLFLYGAMYFFQAPIMSLVDSYTVLGEDRSFGGKRAWGAVGFAGGVFLAGRISAVIGLRIIFGMYEISYAVTIIALIVLHSKFRKLGTDVKPEKKADKSKKYKDLFQSRKLVKLLVCVFFMGGTNIANNTYFSFLYIEGGGTIAGLGACMLFMVGSEIPFMACSRRLSEKFTTEKIIFAAMCISVVRFIVYGAGLPWWMFFILFFSQGAVNGILLVEFVRCVSSYAPEGCSSLAVSVYYIISGSISAIACQYAGGIILECGGASSVYIFFGLFNLAGVILFVAFGFLNGTEKSERFAKK